MILYSPDLIPKIFLDHSKKLMHTYSWLVTSHRLMLCYYGDLYGSYCTSLAGEKGSGGRMSKK